MRVVNKILIILCVQALGNNFVIAPFSIWRRAMRCTVKAQYARNYILACGVGGCVSKSWPNGPQRALILYPPSSAGFILHGNTHACTLIPLGPRHTKSIIRYH